MANLAGCRCNLSNKDFSPFRLTTVFAFGRGVDLGSSRMIWEVDWDLGMEEVGAGDRRLRGGVGNNDFNEGMV